MKSRSKNKNQTSFLMPGLAEQLDPKQPLYRLAEAIEWESFEKAYEDFYSKEGRPAKPVRLMVGLLLLKHLENLSDEVVCDRWAQNPYYQFFCGMTEFQWTLPCDPTDLVYFRKRIGDEGMSLILAESVRLNGVEDKLDEVIVDSTVQEKNITFPTDTKLYRKIIQRLWRLADEAGVRLRRRYGKAVKKALLAIRFMRRRSARKAGIKAQRGLRTIAGRLLRELKRKLAPELYELHQEALALYERALGQRREDKNKIYSLHEPQVYCLSKGKDHKKYEFGCKSSIAVTREGGVVVAAISHEKNQHDSRTLDEVLDQIELITDRRPKVAITDRGYRGRNEVNGTDIAVPGTKTKGQDAQEQEALRKKFRRRSSIEPVIGHLKKEHRLGLNYLKGAVGDTINVVLAAATWNLKKWMRETAIA